MNASEEGNTEPQDPIMCGTLMDLIKLSRLDSQLMAILSAGV